MKKRLTTVERKFIQRLIYRDQAEKEDRFCQYQVDYVSLAAAGIPVSVIEHYFERKFANDSDLDVVMQIQDAGGFARVAHYMVQQFKELAAENAVFIIKSIH